MLANIKNLFNINIFCGKKKKKKKKIHPLVVTNNKLEKYLHNSLKKYEYSSVNDISEVKLKKTISTICFIDLIGYSKYAKNEDSNIVFSLLNFWYIFLNNIIKEINNDNKRPFRHEISGDGIFYILNHHFKNDNHQKDMINFAIKVISRLNDLKDFIEEKFKYKNFGVRIGIHYGEVTGGLVTGLMKPINLKYQILGDTVNFAKRLEQSSIPMCINLSKEIKLLIEKKDENYFKNLKKKSIRIKKFKSLVKHEGEIETYLLQPVNYIYSKISPKMGKKVLVIDDSPSICLKFKYILNKFCYVTICNSGVEALKLIKEGRYYDLIFIDLIMEEMDAFSTTLHIRNYEKKFNIKKKHHIIGMSAQHISKSLLKKSKHIGMNNLKRKIFNYEDLYNIIINNKIDNKIKLDKSVSFSNFEKIIKNYKL